MFDRVIALLDGTSADASAVAHAAVESSRHRARLDLMMVVPQPEPFPEHHHVRGGAPIADLGTSELELSDELLRARDHLQAMVREVEPLTSCDSTCEVGDPYRRLKAHCERFRRPLIVICTGVSGGLIAHPVGLAVRRLISEGAVDVMVVHDGHEVARASAWLHPVPDASMLPG